MTVFNEGELQLTVHGAVDARKFDDNDVHGLSHCMKAVDFVIELDDRYLFVEFKDPQSSRSGEAERKAYIRNFQAGRLDEDLKHKYRDSFLYEFAAGRADKPIDYLILIALNTLTDPLLRARKRQLERKLPVRGPEGRAWPRPFVRSCTVFNIDSWNRHLPKYPVERRSATP